LFEKRDPGADPAEELAEFQRDVATTDDRKLS
jgi:hypothetical protein